MRRFLRMMLPLALSATAALAVDPPPVRGEVDLAVSFDPRPLAELDADAVAVPIFDGEELATALGSASATASPAVAAAARLGLLPAKRFEILPLVAPQGFRAASLWLVPAGASDGLDAERLRRFAGAAVHELRRHEVGSLTLFLRGGVPGEAAAGAAVEGALMGLFDAGIHKTDGRRSRMASLRLAGIADTPGARAAVERARGRGRAVNFARSLAVEPANYVYPEVLAEHARALAREAGLEVEVLDETAIQRRGFGGVWAVGKGGGNPPRVIVLRYRAPVPSAVTLALVGKGVCFDSGGLSLKPGENMHEMKADMAGGAAVLAAMKMIAAERPGVNVLGVVAAVENMPDGRAQRPGDVFVGYSGKTVEVLSTDAEGRLILSDALAYAVEQGATHLVDIATLTGTVIRALGDHRAGAFASDERLYAALERAAARTGERFWRLPIDEEHGEGIEKSLVADLNETGGKAGASVGAHFLRAFTGGRPWIHLDIAGVAWPDDKVSYRDKGPTGAPARTLAELAHALAETD